MEYKVVYTIWGQKIQKGELAKISIKIDDNPYHNIEMSAPNIELYYSEEEAKKALQASLHAQMKEISERLEEI